MALAMSNTIKRPRTKPKSSLKMRKMEKIFKKDKLMLDLGEIPTSFSGR